MTERQSPREDIPGYFVALPGSRQATSFEFSAVLRRLKTHWRLVAAIVFFCTGAAVIAALLMGRVYRAEVTLAPAITDSSSFSGSLMGISAGFSSIAGLELPGMGGNRIQAIATLKSRYLAELFIRDENLIPVLFSERWDADARRWTVPEEKVPTMWDAYGRFNSSVRTVLEDKRTGLITLVMTWNSPELAATWANKFVQRANELMRQRALSESERNLTYLQDQSRRTSLVELQQAVSKLTEMEMKKAMLARGNEEYAFKVIDPAVVPKYAYKPKRKLIAVIGALVGCLIALLTLILVGPSREKTPHHPD